MDFWKAFGDDIIIEYGFDDTELGDLDSMSQTELNNLLQYLVYLAVNSSCGGNYEDMYYYLAEDCGYDIDTVGFLLEI